MMGVMRASVFAAVLMAFGTGPAFADQTDPRLDGLFEHLRTGETRNADDLEYRISEIWADSASDTVDLLFRRAIEAAAGDRLDLSAALLDHAIGLSPSFAAAYAYRGALRFRLNDAPGGIADLTRAIELEPRQYQARIALAEVMLSNGDKRGAYNMLQKALEWNPHETHARDLAKSLRATLDGQEI